MSRFKSPIGIALTLLLSSLSVVVGSALPASAAWTPRLQSISVAGQTPTGALDVHFVVTFHAAVAGVSAGNFRLTTTGVSGASIDSVSGTGATRTVRVNTGTGDGTIRAFAACASPATYNGLGDGSHTVQVRAADTAGNVDPTPASGTGR